MRAELNAFVPWQLAAKDGPLEHELAPHSARGKLHCSKFGRFEKCNHEWRIYCLGRRYRLHLVAASTDCLQEG